MSKNRYKVEYTCDCGVDYGSCGRKSVYLFEYNCSIDLGTLVHHSHCEDPKSKPEYMGVLSDNQIAALIEVLTGGKEGPWTKEDHDKLKECRGW